MARFPDLLAPDGFASATTHYMDRYPGQDNHARIVVLVRLENGLQIPAVVDTGAPWCVLDPEIADELLASQLAQFTSDTETMRIRGAKHRGKLVRMNMGVQVDQGQDFEVESTVFVPTLQPGERWEVPNFLGLTGFLERIRFADDPEESILYLGYS